MATTENDIVAGIAEIAVQLEDKYGAQIPDEDMASLKTIGDAVAYVQRSRPRSRSLLRSWRRNSRKGSRIELEASE